MCGSALEISIINGKIMKKAEVFFACNYIRSKFACTYMYFLQKGRILYQQFFWKMKRSSFIKTGGLIAAAQITGMTNINAFAKFTESLAPTDRMPAMFIGHGNPMNAIENNFFRQNWVDIGKKLPKPKAILAISAHWLTQETKVTITPKPRTIHDFGGFPKKLFEQEYPAPGSPEFAQMTRGLVQHTHIGTDNDWGLDHGAWSVLLPMFPLADIPVFQLSLVYAQTIDYHYQIGKQLNALREKGVLVIGSGNLVHNLSEVDWNGGNKVYDWAQEFDTKMAKWITDGDHTSVLKYRQLLGATADKAHPSYDHLLPLFYVLGLQQKNETVSYFNDRFDMASISMRSFIVQ
jgi:4,5-DOPA dioxygenase extradiol